MLRNYLLVSLRNMFRNKTVSVIHIAGLGLGIAAFLFSVQTVNFEYSFDDFHSDRDRIYAVSVVFTNQDGTKGSFISAVPALYHSLKSNLPEIEYAARYIAQDKREPYCVVSFVGPDGKEVSHNEINARYVDEDFLKIFSFKVIKGSPDGQLGNPNSIVLTQSLARKYFGDQDPIGKTVEVRTGGVETTKSAFSCHVTAVLEDLPPNSSLQFELLLPYRNFEEYYIQDLKNVWFWPGFFTFIKVRDGADVSDLSARIQGLVPAEVDKDLRSTGSSYLFYILPFSGVHFASDQVDSQWAEIRTANNTYTNMVGIIGLSILIVAGVNYVNLTTARSLKRAREVGIRKVVGASRWQLARQFLLDAFVVNALGYALGLTLLQIAHPMILLWTGYHPVVMQWDESHLAVRFGIVVVSTLLSGILPAAFLTSFEPSQALKGVGLHTARGGFMRKSLVVFQFVVSIGLVIFSYAIFLQVGHLRSKDKGFNGEQRLVIDNIGTEDFDFSKYDLFRKRIEASSRVISSTGSLSTPGNRNGNAAMFATFEQPEVRFLMNFNTVDYGFARTIGLKVIAGQEFTEQRVAGERVVMVNETAVRRFGYKSNEEAVGSMLRFFWSGKEGDRDVRIIGVVADFNTLSPGQLIWPEVFMFRDTCWPYGQFDYFTVHLTPGNPQEAIAFLKQQWDETFEYSPFQYTFLDQNYQKVFDQDEKTQMIAGISTVLAMLIACMGLGGLVSYTVGQRVKEIGIRKVLGASVSRILMMLSGDFVRLILVAVLLALPIAWFAVNQFLLGYEYRIDLSVWMFVVPCFTLLAIAVLTISYQTLKAATSNPVDALKYE